MKFGAEYEVLKVNINKSIADEMFDFYIPKESLVADETKLSATRLLPQSFLQ